jgi:hypothetical protein
MKFKTTQKAIRDGYSKIYRCGYCDLQNLFRHTSATAYTFGVYGWNFDLYDIDGVAITTGYRGMIGKCIPSELIRKYESKAKKAIERGNFEYKKIKSALDKLIAKFIEELTNEG